MIPATCVKSNRVFSCVFLPEELGRCGFENVGGATTCVYKSSRTQ